MGEELRAWGVGSPRSASSAWAPPPVSLSSPSAWSPELEAMEGTVLAPSPPSVPEPCEHCTYTALHWVHTSPFPRPSGRPPSPLSQAVSAAVAAAPAVLPISALHLASSSWRQVTAPQAARPAAHPPHRPPPGTPASPFCACPHPSPTANSHSFLRASLADTSSRKPPTPISSFSPFLPAFLPSLLPSFLSLVLSRTLY